MAATRRLDALRWKGEKGCNGTDAGITVVAAHRHYARAYRRTYRSELEKATIRTRWRPAARGRLDGETAAVVDDRVAQSEVVGPMNVTYYSRRLRQRLCER